eukprot:gnl/MRDRNA2_/MRDRNA2_77233_c0_seq1.p1 gnl/MRDRNA2_/MRDRNA2_77233_c0~~gnl/MRDRNA2_/MRDRNA2_77233_c0_seq1.p1  ORF type:complete len:455 (+),score=73.56 gnl/MRDRNA2_/MRDRNA2_77233_c0_seq1:109-1473(+)
MSSSAVLIGFLLVFLSAETASTTREAGPLTCRKPKSFVGKLQANDHGLGIEKEYPDKIERIDHYVSKTEKKDHSFSEIGKAINILTADGGEIQRIDQYANEIPLQSPTTTSSPTANLGVVKLSAMSLIKPTQEVLKASKPKAFVVKKDYLDETDLVNHYDSKSKQIDHSSSEIDNAVDIFTVDDGEAERADLYASKVQLRSPTMANLSVIKSSLLSPSKLTDAELKDQWKFGKKSSDIVQVWKAFFTHDKWKSTEWPKFQKSSYRQKIVMLEDLTDQFISVYSQQLKGPPNKEKVGTTTNQEDKKDGCLSQTPDTCTNYYEKVVVNEKMGEMQEFGEMGELSISQCVVEYGDKAKNFVKWIKKNHKDKDWKAKLKKILPKKPSEGVCRSISLDMGVILSKDVQDELRRSWKEMAEINLQKVQQKKTQYEETMGHLVNSKWDSYYGGKRMPNIRS